MHETRNRIHVLYGKVVDLIDDEVSRKQAEHGQKITPAARTFYRRHEVVNGRYENRRIEERALFSAASRKEHLQELILLWEDTVEFSLYQGILRLSMKAGLFLHLFFHVQFLYRLRANEYCHLIRLEVDTLAILIAGL